MYKTLPTFYGIILFLSMTILVNGTLWHWYHRDPFGFGTENPKRKGFGSRFMDIQFRSAPYYAFVEKYEQW